MGKLSIVYFIVGTALFSAAAAAGNCFCNSIECSNHTSVVGQSLILECNGEQLDLYFSSANQNNITFRIGNSYYTVYDIHKIEYMNYSPFGVKVLGRDATTYYLNFCDEPYCTENLQIQLYDPIEPKFVGEDFQINFEVLYKGVPFNSSVNATLAGTELLLNKVGTGFYTTTVSMDHAGEYDLNISASDQYFNISRNETVVSKYGFLSHTVEVVPYPINMSIVSPQKYATYGADEEVQIAVEVKSNGSHVPGLNLVGTAFHDSEPLQTFALKEESGLYVYTLRTYFLKTGLITLMINITDPLYENSETGYILVSQGPYAVRISGFESEYEYTNQINFKTWVTNENGMSITDMEMHAEIEGEMDLGKKNYSSQDAGHLFSFNAYELGPGDYILKVTAQNENVELNASFGFRILNESDEYKIIVKQPFSGSRLTPNINSKIIAYVTRNDYGIRVDPLLFYAVITDLVSSQQKVYHLFDDGTHGDQNSGDGLYSAVFNTSDEGYYSVELFYEFDENFTLRTDIILYESRKLTVPEAPEKEDQRIERRPMLINILSPKQGQLYPKNATLPVRAELISLSTLLSGATINALFNCSGLEQNFILDEISDGIYFLPYTPAKTGNCSMEMIASKQGYASESRSIDFRVVDVAPSYTVAISYTPSLLEEPMDLNVIVRKNGEPVEGAQVYLKLDNIAYPISEKGSGVYTTSFIPEKNIYFLEAAATKGGEYGEFSDMLSIGANFLSVRIRSPVSNAELTPGQKTLISAEVTDQNDQLVDDAYVEATILGKRGEEIHQLYYSNWTYEHHFYPQEEGEYTIIVTAEKTGYQTGADTVIVTTPVGRRFSYSVEKAIIVIVVAVSLVLIFSYYYGIIL